MDRPALRPEATRSETARSETGRLEAFSDGVIAIIITIMVLELRPPERPSLAALFHLWPVLMAYGLSFAQVGIYWVNHHRLLERADSSGTRLHWANLLWLFCVSLIPFGTAWFGEFPWNPIPTAIYLTTLLLPALAYIWLESEAMCSSDHEAANRNEHDTQQNKAMASMVVYAAGIGLAFVTPIASIACVVIVAIFWIAPGSRVDRWFGGKRF
jgi:uncharacterized membrane protein